MVLALSGDPQSFIHIARTVLPSAGATTLGVMIGVGLLTALIGTLTAWLVTYFEFPLRKMFSWALMLPLAVPTYISGYTFVEFFSYTGPVQEAVRIVGGYQSAREYWFPDIRSLWGTVFVFSLVLYPYVYLSVRTLFLIQGNHLTDSARMLGASASRLFWTITLPLARPAIFLGVTLALMETINDIGAVEYLGTHTLTFSVFSVWLNQNDLPGAVQIALFLLVLVFALIWLEHHLRGSRHYTEKRLSGTPTEGFRELPKVTGYKAVLVMLMVAMPIVTGFGIPMFMLIDAVIADPAQWRADTLISSLYTTLGLGMVAACLAVMGGMLISYLMRVKPTNANRLIVRLCTIGYAVPGTIIALGVFIPLAAFDNFFDGLMRQYLGISTGLLLTGSGAALVFAYVVRFMAMAEGNIENGMEKISTNLDMAAKTLGRNRLGVLRQIVLPLMLPAVTSAGLLVFVDVVKELSATILLRPFGTNTLATHVYDFASQGRVEEGAAACILIVTIGMVPVILLARQN